MPSSNFYNKVFIDNIYFDVFLDHKLLKDFTSSSDLKLDYLYYILIDLVYINNNLLDKVYTKDKIHLMQMIKINKSKKLDEIIAEFLEIIFSILKLN